MQFAVAADAAVPIAHGRFNDLIAPEFSIPGMRLDFDATALNDGNSTGWFRICVIRVDPPLTKYYPAPWDETYAEWAVHCSETDQVAPGARINFLSNKFRMQSFPNETFWVLLVVQQQAPLLLSYSENGTDWTELKNMAIDELRVVVITNLYA